MCGLYFKWHNVYNVYKDFISRYVIAFERLKLFLYTRYLCNACESMKQNTYQCNNHICTHVLLIQNTSLTSKIFLELVVNDCGTGP